MIRERAMSTILSTRDIDDPFSTNCDPPQGRDSIRRLRYCPGSSRRGQMRVKMTRSCFLWFLPLRRIERFNIRQFIRQLWYIIPM